MTKSSEIRYNILKTLKFQSQLDMMEHFLDEQFRNIKSDRKMIRKYVLDAVTHLEKCNEDLVVNDNEINKEDKSIISPTSPSRSVSE